MTDDRTDSATLTWRDAQGEGYRIVVEPLDSGGYERREERFADGQWTEQGREVVTHVDIEAPENSDFLSLFPRSQTDA